MIELRWPGAPGERYALQVSRAPDFAVVLHALQTEAPRIVLPRLAPGRWYVRLQRTTADGVVTPYSPAQVLEVPALVRGADGAAIQSGSGSPLESTR